MKLQKKKISSEGSSKKNVRGLFLCSTLIFTVLLFIFSSMAVYFSCSDKQGRIVSSMDTINTYVSQEYESITHNFWQTYMPFYEDTENIALMQSYFLSDRDFSPIKLRQLSNLLKKICLRDDRILWAALYAPSAAINYIQFASEDTISELPVDFPYLAALQDKQKTMEIYSFKSFSSGSQQMESFAISGGLPFGMNGGSILIGYRTSSLEQASYLFPNHVTTMRYYIVSKGQVIFHSDRTLLHAFDRSQDADDEITDIYIPDHAFEGVIQVNGHRQYVKAIQAGNNTSFVVCAVDNADLLRAMHRHTPLLIGLFAAFFAFSIYVSHYIQKQVTKETAIIRKGLTILADNHWDYRLPTDFHQAGFPEIAQDINLMGSKLNESIKKAYYFELKQKDAEMAELQATFNPHFLYNTLEMLRNKCFSNGDEETAELIASLASIFRGFIGAKTFVSFPEELAFSKKYLSLLAARYGDTVQFHYDFDSALMKYGIIRNVFQLLIENYFVHGFDTARTDNRIDFIGYPSHENDDDIILCVRDNGFGMTKQGIDALNLAIEQPIRHTKENFGLKNLNQRLKLFYGSDYGLHIAANEAGGVSVWIRIRKMTVAEYEQSIQQRNRNR